MRRRIKRRIRIGGGQNGESPILIHLRHNQGPPERAPTIASLRAPSKTPPQYQGNSSIFRYP